jgi:serine/threonine-protein kinase
MGIVYLAKDKRLKRAVAIKVLPPELAFRTEIRTRFLREAETAAQLSHPNIVPIYSVDERDGIVYFVMAYVDGENLGSRLHRQGALEADECRRILLEVARALDYAHERKVVHRDIKPDNILLQQEDGRVMVTDFGIARATEGADARLTATGMAIGTPAYMSPEQSTGERTIDGRSDLYSLGVVGYQMITGDLPFEAQSTPALLVKHLSERPDPIEVRRPDVPPDLGRAVMLCLEKEPSSRFPSAGALAVALESGDVPALPEVETPVRQTPVRRLQAYGLEQADEEPYLRRRVPDPRWNDRKVVEFRKKLAPWVAVGVSSVFINAITGFDVLWLWGAWSVWLAYKYAQLWTDGYDWRDVLKEPKDRLFYDVVAEWIDNVRAIWDKNKRAELRGRERARRERPALFESEQEPRGALPPARRSAGRDRGSPTGSHTGSHTGSRGVAVREAARHRDDILRMVEMLPRHDRDVIAEVPATARALFDRVQALSDNLLDLERNATPAAATSVEQEIAALEAQANPLDSGSEERVRRLAYLKRQRRAIADLTKRRESSNEKLERCLLALQNMRLDVLRLKAGGQTVQQITQVAEKAMALAREVETRMYVADEMSKLGPGNPGVGGR